MCSNTIPFVLPKDNTVTLSHPERYLKTRLVSYSRKTAAQHVFLSLTEAKPSKDNASVFPPESKHQREERSPRLSGVCGGPTSLFHDHGFPTVATLPLWHPSLCTPRQSFAYLPIERMRVPRRAAKFYYRTLVCGIGPRGGWTDENRSCSREKRNKEKPGRCQGNEDYEKYYERISAWRMFWEYWVFFSFFFWSWICLDLRDLCNFDERMI